MSTTLELRTMHADDGTAWSQYWNVDADRPATAAEQIQHLTGLPVADAAWWETTTDGHVVTVVATEPAPVFGTDHAHRLACTCGERVVYRGRAFTIVEAERHVRYHDRKADR